MDTHIYVYTMCVCVCLQTWWSSDGQVPEVTSFNELHRHPSCGGIVGQTYEQLRSATMCQ